MLEVDENILATPGRFGYRLGPLLDIRPLVTLVAQPEVGVVGCDLQRGRLLVGV